MRARAHSVKYTRRNSPEESFLVYFPYPEASAGAALDPSGQVTGDGLGEERQTDLETVAPETSYVNEQASTRINLSKAINSAVGIVPSKSTITSSFPTPEVYSASGLAAGDISTNTTTTSSSASPPGSSAPTSSSDTAQPTSTRPPIHNGLGRYGGMVFGVLMGVGFIVILTMCWIRARSNIRRRSMKRMTTWPWDHDRLGARARQDTLERGREARPGLRTWDPARMVEAQASASDGGKSRFSIEDDLPPPLPRTDPRLEAKDSQAFPLPPAQHLDLPAYAGNRSPFVAVPLHANRNREQSVPDIMQEMGTLKIANLMPGDILTSGGESSRASTALGFSDASPDWKSDAMGSPTTPHAAVDGDTPTPRLPWAPLRTWKTKGGWQEGHMLEDGDDGPLPFPGNSPAAPEPEVEPETNPDSWAVSFRSNLANALNAMVGGSAPQAKVVGIGSDNLTRPPERRNSQRRRGARGRHESRDVISRPDTASSASSPTGWTLEEIEGGRGVVRFRGDPEQGSALTEDPFSDDSQVRPEDTAAQKQDGDCLETFDRAPDTTGRPPTDLGTAETPPLQSHPPELPSIPSVPKPPGGEKPGAGLVKKTTPRPHRGRTKRRRPRMVTRKSSSQSSAVSVGSDMSRVSSVPSEELTDAERFAKHVLRERRRRVMERAVGQGRPSRSRATTISRRRPKEKIKQRVEREAS